MIDIDLFKKEHDRYGHRKGDIVLRQIADTIVGVIRESESLCRIGGEEFMAVAPETSLENALALGERLRAAVESIAWEESIHVTVSIGVTEFRSEDTVDSFQRRADSALYAAKRNGRNRVETVYQDA
jgi:diguanylate cyclase (GGDEF)-like protein